MIVFATPLTTHQRREWWRSITYRERVVWHCVNQHKSTMEMARLTGRTTAEVRSFVKRQRIKIERNGA